MEGGIYHQLGNRTSYAAGIAGMIHGKYDNVTYYGKPQSPSSSDAVYITTGGIQLQGTFNVTLIQFADNIVQLGAGPVLRYQMTSYPDILGSYPPNLNNPELTYSFRYDSPPATFSAGYLFQLSYLVKMSAKDAIGVKASYQNDTNGDAITAISLQFAHNVRW